MYQQSYYGPPIPPTAPPKRRFCRCSLCCCLLSTIISLILIVGIFFLVVWLVLRPKIITVAVEDVKLNSFNLSSTSNTTLTYNLATNISFTNPNTKIGVYYDYLEADFYYDDWRFGFTPLQTFYQSTRDTQYLSSNVSGSTAVLSSSVGSKYNSDKSSGVYVIEMWIYGRSRLKVGGSAGSSRKMRVRCDLRVPSSSSSAIKFQRTECDVVKF